MNSQSQPVWTDPNLPPDQFLYERKGPWPQPAPAYPMARPPEVLTVPWQEYDEWWLTIGVKLLAEYGVEKLLAPAQAQADLELSLQTDEEFVRMMTQTVYCRYLRNESGTAN